MAKSIKTQTITKGVNAKNTKKVEAPKKGAGRPKKEENTEDISKMTKAQLIEKLNDLGISEADVKKELKKKTAPVVSELRDALKKAMKGSKSGKKEDKKDKKAKEESSEEEEVIEEKKPKKSGK